MSNTPPVNNHHEDDNNTAFLSRTARKKSMEKYRIISQQLLGLNKTKLSQIPLTDEIIAAIAVARKIKSDNALNRQMAFISKQIKNSDYESIQAAFDHLKQQDSRHKQASKMAEQWYDRLLMETSQALSEFIEQYPACDKQNLNQLVRNALKEKKRRDDAEHHDTNAKYKGALLKLLRHVIASERPSGDDTFS